MSTRVDMGADIQRLRTILAALPPAVLGVALVQLGDHRPVTDPTVIAVLLAAEQILARTPSPADDRPGGRYHRAPDLDAYGALARHRYPPTGNRDLWIRYGPAGPPTSLHAVPATCPAERPVERQEPRSA